MGVAVSAGTGLDGAATWVYPCWIIRQTQGRGYQQVDGPARNHDSNSRGAPIGWRALSFTLVLRPSLVDLVDEPH